MESVTSFDMLQPTSSRPSFSFYKRGHPKSRAKHYITAGTTLSEGATDNRQFHTCWHSLVYEMSSCDAPKSYYTSSKTWTSCLTPMWKSSASKYGSPTGNFHDPPPFLPQYMGLHHSHDFASLLLHMQLKRKWSLGTRLTANRSERNTT